MKRANNRANDREAINNIVRSFKKNTINKSVALERLAHLFQPLYLRNCRRIADVDMSTNNNGDLYNVFLETLSYSLDKFSFDKNTHKENKLSFVPFFTSMMHNRVNDYMSDVYKEIERRKTLIPIDNPTSGEEIDLKFAQECINKMSIHIDAFIDSDKDLDQYLQKNLSPLEYKILDLRIRDWSFQEIVTKIRYPNSRETLRKDWDQIANKIKKLIEVRQCLN